jgi:hypothetical protein
MDKINVCPLRPHEQKKLIVLAFRTGPLEFSVRTKAAESCPEGREILEPRSREVALEIDMYVRTVRLSEVVRVGAYPRPRPRKPSGLKSPAQLQALLQIHRVLHFLPVRRPDLVDQPVQRPVHAGLITLQHLGLRQQIVRKASEQGREIVRVNRVRGRQHQRRTGGQSAACGLDAGTPWRLWASFKSQLSKHRVCGRGCVATPPYCGGYARRSDTSRAM